MDEAQFIIGNIYDDELYWSNDLGWTDIDLCDKFTVEEHDTLTLPIDGEWVVFFKVWPV